MAETINTYKNIFGKPYGEDKESFVRTFTITVTDDYEDTRHLNAIHSMTVLDPSVFSESLFIFADEFFDSGVLAHRIEPICRGWDDSDFMCALFDLVEQVIFDGRTIDVDTRRNVLDSIVLEDTNDGGNDTVRSASLHYSDMRRLIDGPTVRRAIESEN